jgi:hypothetical protein
MVETYSDFGPLKDDFKDVINSNLDSLILLAKTARKNVKVAAHFKDAYLVTLADLAKNVSAKSA